MAFPFIMNSKKFLKLFKDVFYYHQMTLGKNLCKAAKIIKESNALLITAGAGVGVDSGLPDFRGPEGFWKAYPPFKSKGLELHDVSNPDWFRRDPHFVWGFYGHRYHLYKNTIPHEGFAILKELADSKDKGYFIFTSNVDGHFQKAGFDGDKIVECHGSINHLQHLNGEFGTIDEIWDTGEDFSVKYDSETFRATDPLPKIPGMNLLARPNILMFGDYYWNSSRTDKQMQRFYEWFQKVQDELLVVIEIGAGCYVPTVRKFSESVVQRSKKDSRYIRINPKEADVSGSKNISLPLGGLECLKLLKNKLHITE